MACPKKGKTILRVLSKQGTYFKIFFVLDRLRVSNPLQFTYITIIFYYIYNHYTGGVSPL